MSNTINDELAANCRRHGGTAAIINCWECHAEFAEDDYEYDEEDDDDDI